MTIRERAEKLYGYFYNVKDYVRGATEERDIILDAYCKTCCNLDRKTCLASGGECKQYEKLIKNIEEV